MNAFSLPDPLATAVDEAIRRDLRETRWSGGLQELYEREIIAKRVREIRFIHLVAFWFGLACLALDEMTGVFYEGLLLRGGVCALVFIPAICTPRSDRQWLETVRALAPPLIATFSITTLAEFAPPDHTDRYLMAGGFYVSVAIILLPLRMREHALLSALGFIALILPAFIAVRFAFVPHAELMLFLLLCCLGPLALANRTARLRDRNFLLVLQARLVQEKLIRSNDLLRRLSDEDALTGILNRRGFTQKFDQAYANTLEANETLAVFMIDIDHFKRFNDDYGHPAGDKCLIHVADGLSRRMEEEDGLIGRFGGEEFIAAWRGSSPEEAKAIAEAFRRVVGEIEIRDNGRALPPITVSVGWTSVTGKRPRLSNLINRADKALYRAKQAGRNRAMRYSRNILRDTD